MRHALWVAAAVLASTTGVYGQAGGGQGPQEVICPLDNHRFTPPVGGSGDRAGGVDSDECWHSLASYPLPYLVIVCPRCNYTASRGEFTRELPEAKKPELLRMLVKSRYRGITDTVGAIPAWERFRLAAECARVLDQPASQLAAVKYACWCARVEACRPATMAASQQAQATIAPVTGTAKIVQWMPSRGIDDYIRDAEQKVAAAAKPEEKNRLNLHVAMLCERAGLVAKRDAVVAQLKAAAPADPTLAAQLNHFLSLLGIEREFQTQFLDLLREQIKKTENRETLGPLTYLLADTLRRLGRDAEAVAEDPAARKRMSQPSEYRVYTDYLLTMLAPGEPLPAPEPETAPEPAAPARTETPATIPTP